jgi:hypothetical protein
MKIYFHRSGGLEGSVIEKIIDEKSMNEKEANNLQKIIRDSGFFDLPYEIKTKRNYADAFNYNITIDDGIKAHSVKRTDTNIEPKLYTLVKYFIES